MPAPEELSDASEKLQKYGIVINDARKQVEAILTKLKGILPHIDKTVLPEQVKLWEEHCKKYFSEFAAELAKLPSEMALNLTEEEKNELMRGASIYSIVLEKQKKLKDHGIKVPNNYFAILVYDAIFAALSRKMVANPERLIEKIAKKLAVIDNENAAFQAIKAQYEKQYKSIIKTTSELELQATNIQGLSESDRYAIDEIIRKIKAISEQLTLEAKKLEDSGEM